MVPSLLPSQPDGLKLKPSPASAACGVAPLPAIADTEALAFEQRTSPDTGSLMPALARALEKFKKLVGSVGGTLELRSAYRPQSYQAHLQAVWFKWILELRNNRELGCEALRAQVGEEFRRHHLLIAQKPVTSSDHTRGLAFDATVSVPCMTRLKRRRISLDRLALLVGIWRPDILHDPVHFKLAIGRTRRRT
jgi:D-alanyl-D-alanine dipeptidase